MYDTVESRKLYEKMASINMNLKSLKSNINYLKELLESNFLINDNIVEEKKILSQQQKISNIKHDVKHEIMETLKNNI